MIFAAVAMLNVVIGYLLGWVGRFAVFAATSVAVVAMAGAVGFLGDRGVGQTIVLMIIGFASLQVGYVGFLGVGALRIARARKPSARQAPTQDAPRSASESRSGAPTNGPVRRRSTGVS